MAVQTNTGLPKVDEPRYHFDIYAVLEGPQELYFGHETQVNVNIVETVRIATDEDEMEKCYISPTKRRGVERRSLIWAPVQSKGVLLGEKLGCGVPHTCAQPTCPICAVFGGLITSNTDVDVMGKTEERPATTTIGRLVHGGGVAIQPQDVVEKQRAMHPSMMHKAPEKEPTPVPFRRQYNEPGLLYPVYNHCLSVTEAEFTAVAYAFLDALARLGAGNPKGVRIYEGKLLKEQEPLLVVDRYLVPLGKRPIISPTVTNIEEALAQFRADALQVEGQTVNQHEVTKTLQKMTPDNETFTGQTVAQHEVTKALFTRWLGDAAYQKLQEYAVQFAEAYLT